jgi:hypothetical protein
MYAFHMHQPVSVPLRNDGIGGCARDDRNGAYVTTIGKPTPFGNTSRDK